MKNILLPFCLLLSSFSYSLALAESLKMNCKAAPTVIQSVRVFDGDGVIPTANVVIECGVVASVMEPSSDFEPPEAALVVDGQGHTLIPGLIDAHVHAWRRDHLERALDFGVTMMLDMGSSRALAQSSREEEASGESTDRADLRSAVLWVTAPESHGTQFGEVPTLVEPTDAAEFVAERIEDGADYIKVIYDNFKRFPREIPTLSKDTMEATVAAANQQGRMAVFHSRDLEAMTNAVNAGASGFVHMAVDEVPGDALIRLMKAQDVFVTPNLSLARHEGPRLVDDPYIGPMLTEDELENLQNWRAMRSETGDEVEYEGLMKFHEAGVPVLLGTDMPNGGTVNGASVHLELELLVEAGMSPLDALKAATSRSADAYGLSDRGRIGPGMRADLVLVEGQPDEDITHTRRIKGIWKSGVVHDRKSN